MNIALYTRVSTRDKGQDVENQLRQLREFCAKQDWRIVGEYTDPASGKRSDREQFQQMFTAASRRQFDCVLFWSLDRFSREGVYETLQHLQRLTAYGVGYRSFTEQYLDSCGLFKDAVISILATIAKQERVRLSERTIAGLPARTDYRRLRIVKFFPDDRGTRRVSRSMLSPRARGWVSGLCRATSHRSSK